jgi:hypothetical protein
VAWLGIAFGSRAAGGADSFGYVSEAYLWLQGDLVVADPLMRAVPWPHREMTLTPLAYRPGPDGGSIVPTYAPGVPLVMAAAIRLVGTWGPFLLTPMFAAFLVFGTFVLTWRITADRAAALAAALLMAGSPAFLFNVMWPMSDIAAAALWTWSLLLLAPRRHRDGVGASEAGPGDAGGRTRPAGSGETILAGLLAGAAVLVRPNLVPLTLVGMTAAARWASAPPRRWALHRALLYGGAVIPAALVIALVNHRLYGSPLRSGYGGLSTLYAVGHLGENLAHYVPSLMHSETPLLAVVPLVLALPRVRRAALMPAALPPALGFIAIVWASYLFYLPFHDWWYLRFMLPAFPWMFLLLGVSLAWLARRWPGRGAGALGAIVMLLVAYRIDFAVDRKVLAVGRDEHRYIAVAQYIDRAFSGNAVFLSMQHSGTVRFYTGRHTIRYEAFSAARLPSVFEWLRGQGYRPYILLESWEEAQFVSRFRDAGPAGRLEVPIVAEIVEPVRVRIYDPLPAAGPAPPPDPIPWPRVRRPAEPRGPWAPGGPR